MTFRLMIKNPAYPKDKEKAVALTAAQLKIVEPYILECVNEGRTPKEAKVILQLANAGNPIQFGDPA